MKTKSIKDQFDLFPGTRYMGSKNKIINEIWEVLSKENFESFLDVFAGTNVVSYFMKCKGKTVISNDFMSMSYVQSKAIIENANITLNEDEVDFLIKNKSKSKFIYKTFKDLYFTDEENLLLDTIRSNSNLLENEYKKAIAISSLIRSCMKKRPRGIFTYIGQRYNDGRNDINKSLKDHFKESVEKFNDAVFNNNKNCLSLNIQSLELNSEADLVYLDPPYYSIKSDNDYVRRYHFVEGLSKYWEGVEIQQNTITKKFKSYTSPFSKKESAYQAFDSLIKKHRNSIIAISYSSNSIPTKEELTAILLKYKNNVEVHEIDHVYSFGNQGHKIGNESNKIKEYLFIGKS